MNNFSAFAADTVQKGTLAPEICPDFYRLSQPDCASFDDAAVYKHYHEWGKNEGRCASPAAMRRGFLAQIHENSSVLEIGPAVRPSLFGLNVKYFDVTDRNGLIERARLEGYSIEECPEKIDFISETGDLSIVDEKFDLVFSSHCIEHQPDFVNHLNQVENILREGGYYYLIVPDKRFCFDALIPTSKISQVIRAKEENRTVHTYEKVVEHYSMTTHNDASRHWAGDHYDPSLVAQMEIRAENAETLYKVSAGSYIDVHAWQFTPDSFREIVSELRNRSLIKLEVERVYGTVRNSVEFCAVLRLRAGF